MDSSSLCSFLLLLKLEFLMLGHMTISGLLDFNRWPKVDAMSLFKGMWVFWDQNAIDLIVIEDNFQEISCHV